MGSRPLISQMMVFVGLSHIWVASLSPGEHHDSCGSCYSIS